MASRSDDEKGDVFSEGKDKRGIGPALAIDRDFFYSCATVDGIQSPCHSVEERNPEPLSFR